MSQKRAMQAFATVRDKWVGHAAMATMSDVDNTGSLVERATVNGQFPGDSHASANAVIDANGVVVFTTLTALSGKVTANFCVDAVQSSLNFDAANGTGMCTQ